MDHEQTTRVSFRVLDQKQQNMFGRVSLYMNFDSAIFMQQNYAVV